MLMRNFILPLAIAFCLWPVYLARADDAKPNSKPSESDVKLLQGTWKVVKREKNGEAEDAKQHPTTLKFSDHKIVETEDDKTIQEGTFTLDDSKHPKRMTMSGTAGPNGGSVFEAIYQVDGDSLKLAYGAGSHASTAPKDFKGGDGVGILVLERQK
jgi:uncharacterized protein (TIGR03067 family)